ncbi:MAG: hypothetical protein HY328_05380, partial [Chloroflexi bacterium]|nr:hypothetical protein [Chloroflexota bacterium]
MLASFVYDAEGNRVKGTVGGVNTVYIAGLYEYSGSAAKSYYTGPGGVVALHSGGTVYYLLSDQLNSTARIVNSAGTTQATSYYYPFGGNRGAAFSGLTTRRFTGQYHESTLPGGEGSFSLHHPLPVDGLSPVDGTPPPPLPTSGWVRLSCGLRWERRGVCGGGVGCLGAFLHRHCHSETPVRRHRQSPLSQPDQQP